MTSFTCCKKNPCGNKTTGKYLCCKIDGVDYLPEQSSTFNSPSAFIAKIQQNDSLLIINTYNLSDQSLDFAIWDYTSIKQGSYTLLTKLPYKSFASFDNTPLGSGQFGTDTLNNGVLAITNIDKAKKLIEGTFAFKCFNQLTQKSANITDGEFSLFFNQ